MTSVAPWVPARPNILSLNWVFLDFDISCTSLGHACRLHYRLLRSHMITSMKNAGMVEHNPQIEQFLIETFIRIMTLYQILHDAIHAKSGQEGPLKMQYIRTERESVMGWVSLLHHDLYGLFDGSRIV